MRAALGSTTTLDEQLSDDVLITRIVQGDVPAFEILYDRHAPMVLGIALKITGNQTLAEGVLQETFWQAWQSAASYQPEFSSLSGWLFRIARSLALDSDRQQNAQPGRNVLPAVELLEGIHQKRRDV
jgi:RNA polymerase sigma-70 factor (ECF subfamily)